MKLFKKRYRPRPADTKPWSKLQRDLYNLMDRSDNFQIHCVAYRMPDSWSSCPQIPRYWITVGKGEDQKIIWDYPKDFKGEVKYNMYEHVPNISQLIRVYINTPRPEVLTRDFPEDHYGLIPILRDYDRRFKKIST